MNGFRKFKETLFAEARMVIGRVHEREKAGPKTSNFGQFLLGMTDERKGSNVDGDDAFVVELFQRFAEIFQSIQVLQDIEGYLKRFPPKMSRSRYLAYHVHSYLQEVYVLQQRLDALIKKYERWHKPIVDNTHTSIAVKTCKLLVARSFKDIVIVRGGHVHHRHFSDPELDRLEGWEGLAETSFSDNDRWMREGYRKQANKTRKKWIKQIATNNVATIKVLDLFFSDLYSLTFSSRGKVIVPARYRGSQDRAQQPHAPARA